MDFIFSKGIWLGEGEIKFNASNEEILFFTKWEIDEIKDGIITLKHIVEMQGIDHKNTNYYTIDQIDDRSFQIELQNETLDKVKGKGVYTPSTLTWEFQISDIYEGFEFFEKSNTDECKFHAEYATDNQFKTIIDGIIWKKSF